MTLQEGIFEVRHPDTEAGSSFMLSIIKDSWGCIWGYAVFTDKPPRKGKHYVLSHSARNWIEELEVVHAKNKTGQQPLQDH